MIYTVTLTPGQLGGQTFDIGNQLTQLPAKFTPIDTYLTEADQNAPLQKKLTANGWVYFREGVQPVFAGKSHQVTLSFAYEGDPVLTGLGQYEDGIFNYRNGTEYLYHSNMRTPMPVLISSDGYGIFVDAACDMVFQDKDNVSTWTLGAANQVTYHILTGSCDEIVAQLRQLTGKAPLMPRWVYGYVQSKERYNSGEELVEMAQEFRRREIPIDCLVQDWYTWDLGKWGQKTVDKSRYGNLQGTMDTLHKDHVKLMWSIWPNMSETSENYWQFREKNLLLGTSMTYNPFAKEGRDLYATQCNEEILTAGLDAWWCDNTEPFSDPDWSGETRRDEATRFDLVRTEARRHMPWDQINGFCSHHAKGVFENFRKTAPQKRVVNLTRATYVGDQAYGTILWSGDVCARWDVLKKQIVEAMKIALCGVPYWTLDIGGFFVVKDDWTKRGCNNEGKEKLWFWDGDFNEGVGDLGYCELYTRWFQFATFLPMLRSHGTDTPREPWQFENATFNCAPIIQDYIALRYALMPYLYALGAGVHFQDKVMVRSLLFDFPQDPKAVATTDQYMLGREFLVCPVTEPTYYGPNSTPLNKPHTREVYLPAGTLWYDFYTGKALEGGQTLTWDAPIQQMPLFVKAGAIIPVSTKKAQYADQFGGAYDEIWVYEGADGTFDYYNDNGDGYENRDAVAYTIVYDDATKTLENTPNATFRLHHPDGSQTIHP